MKTIVAIHGIRTGSLNWADIFKVYVEKRFTGGSTMPPGSPEMPPTATNEPIRYISIDWGWMPAILAIFPPYRWWKFNYIKRRLKEIAKETNDLNIIAHSLGTWMAYHAIKQLFIYVNKVIFVSGVVPVGSDIGALLFNRVGMLYNYQSPNDEVARLNPFGHCGYAGFTTSHPRLIQKKFNVEHSEWFTEDEPNFYEMWLKDFLT